MNEKEVKDIAEGVLAETLNALANVKLFGNQAQRDLLRAEADRLSAQTEGGDKFEGLKYVIFADPPGLPHEVVTAAAFRECHGREPGPLLKLFLRDAKGAVWASPRPDWYTPWHPQVGEKVRLENRPGAEGTVLSVPDGLPPMLYCVEWGMVPDEHALSELRPFSFAPPEPEPAPEFPNGTVVANRCGDIRVATVEAGENRYTPLSGEFSSPCDGRDEGFRVASDKDIEKYARRGCIAVTSALRAYARQLAKEAK